MASLEILGSGHIDQRESAFPMAVQLNNGELLCSTVGLASVIREPFSACQQTTVIPGVHRKLSRFPKTVRWKSRTACCICPQVDCWHRQPHWPARRHSEHGFTWPALTTRGAPGTIQLRFTIPTDSSAILNRSLRNWPRTSLWALPGR